MSLKTEIDKTNKLQNDLKIAKQNINARILSGGGTTANTLNGVPAAIDSMLRNYKKIAIWEGNESFKPAYGRVSSWQKTLNCDFVIKRFILFRKDSSGQGVRLGMDSEDYKTFRRPTEGGTYAGPPAKLICSNQTVIYEIDNADSYVINETISKIIAIG